MKHKKFWLETITDAAMALEGPDGGDDLGVDSSDICIFL
jgi:hypothetical protein